MYESSGSETMIWREKERSRIRAVQMDNLRDLLSIKRIDRVLNARVKELCGVTKRVDERIEEGLLGWFVFIDRIMDCKRVYVGKYVGNRLVGRPRKRGY